MSAGGPYRAVSRERVAAAAWNELVESSPDAWLWHRHEFPPVLATWPAYEDESFAIVESRRDELVGLVPCYRRGENAIDCFGGPAVASVIGAKRRSEVLRWAHDHLLERAQMLRRNIVDTRLSQMAPAYRGQGCPRVNPLLLYGYENALSQTYVIDATRSEEQIWNDLLPHCRTHIRKAQKEGCSVTIAPATEEALDIYYGLHCTTYERTGVPPHPRTYFEQIWKMFVGSGLAIVFFAVKNGQVIAADNEIFYKGAMSGWTAAGLVDAARIGANNLLHWTALRWARERGAVIYESGEAFPGAKEGKRKGLNDFKRSFGGELFPIYRGEIRLEAVSASAPPADGPAERPPANPERGGILRRIASRVLR